MHTARTVRELRSFREGLPGPVALVPTMGALHAGHASLVRRARAACRSLIVSSFVNPLQFGAGEDLGRYPRTPEDDARLLADEGVDLLFAPPEAEMYPRPQEIVVQPLTLAQHCEGLRRPDHFRGVATVVLKLLNLCRPQQAYFGEKDAQQLAVVRRLVADLHLDCDIVACPIVREADGLALSSRNRYLSPSERAAAPNLHRALQVIATALASGRSDVNALLADSRARMSPLRCDYLAVVRPDEFIPLDAVPADSELLAVGAAFAGNTRLIDAVKARTPKRPTEENVR
ncbi:MAG: pantoate--beta-alanine ligase [Candidatus Eremiobacter antarcticus]|nr:pantoate--beta-alanine ligase [Candidatus Eremiobacteraeota bacterium]MBC5807974.1 pantoate--beta-alanine ligase [Candidatus Eremiobacteraeota bacterium]PZR62665.1 MAG: pantoate--beta-alanine ligase [Candidatus Eremiobacter sp. RRmetagenome_bin22]